MISDQMGTDGSNDATREALARMDAARERVRQRWFSPEAMAISFGDLPEVIGTRDYERDPDYLRWKNVSCTREQ